LSTFIEHDAVPWNNNNAENAIRQFAYYRDGNPGRLREHGLKDYLVLLGLYQTCRYKGISFLKFLLSRERDMDAFCQGRGRRRLPAIEVYPKGFGRPGFGPSRADVAREEMRQLQGQWDLVERITPAGTVIQCQCEGSSSPGGLHPAKLTFTGDTVSPDIDWPDEPNRLKGRCQLNPKRRPKIIDIVLVDPSFLRGAWEGQTTPGIYELEDNRLRLPVPRAGDEKRPSGFKPGDGNWVYTLKRKEH
jgi:uncharacterized protein (TIGR03067 family)